MDALGRSWSLEVLGRGTGGVLLQWKQPRLPGAHHLAPPQGSTPPAGSNHIANHLDIKALEQTQIVVPHSLSVTREMRRR